MRQLHTEISTLENNVLHIELIEDPQLLCRFHSQPEYHSHPEVELLYVIQGEGKRIINGKTEKFTNGDMVFLGAHVPHIWLIDPNGDKETMKRNRCLLLYFDPKKFQELFRTVREFNSIYALLENASRAISIHGETRNQINDLLHKLLAADGFQKVHGVLNILHQLSISNDTTFITSEADSVDVFAKKSDPLIAVVQHIRDHLHTQITLSDVADIAMMSENAFCRFFKDRLKMSFSSYLQDQRLSHAQMLLGQSSKPISEIGELCGYNSISHFCKVFKNKYQISPFQYRQVISA